MAECYYEPTPATDGATMNPVPGAVFQVFEIADTTFSTPLSLRVGAGNPTTTVTASESLATLPGVYVTSPNFEHIWVSGSFRWRRDSIDGAKAAIQDAKVAAQLAAENAAAELSARIAAGEFQGEPGRDGSNVVPTAQAIATEISTEGTPAHTALSATTMQVYGVAPPTGNDSVDTAAIQSVIDKASAAGGGIVQLRPGTYRMNAEIELKNRVILRGVSRRSTTLLWATDLGAGKCAVRPPAGAGFQLEAPQVEELGIIGPYQTMTVGVQGVNMDGWKVGRDVCGNRVFVGGFRAGVVIVGDHNTFVSCKFGNNYYNALHPHDFLTKGNATWIACNLDGARFACVAIEGANSLDSSQFFGGHIGAAPYAFYKFDGAQPSTGGMLSNCILDMLAFEYIGNAAMLDESTGTGSGSDSIINTYITNVGFSWDSKYRIAARPRDYSVSVRHVAGSRIFSGAYPFLAGDVAVFSINSLSSAIDLQIQVPESSAVPTIVGKADSILLERGDVRARYRQTTANISERNLLESAQSAVVPYGTDSREFAGVALQNAVANGNVAVAYEGRVFVDIDTVGVATGGVPVKPSSTTPSKVAPASGKGTGGYAYGGDVTPSAHPIIGFSDRDMPALGTARMWLSLPRTDRTYNRPGAVTTLPAASSAFRGQMLRVDGAAGVADVVYMCVKDAANVYSWKAVTLA